MNFYLRILIFVVLIACGNSFLYNTLRTRRFRLSSVSTEQVSPSVVKFDAVKSTACLEFALSVGEISDVVQKCCSIINKVMLAELVKFVYAL